MNRCSSPLALPPQGPGRTPARDGVASLAREPLPLPDLPPQRTFAVVYGASASMTVGDRVVLRALGWPAGHRLYRNRITDHWRTRRLGFQSWGRRGSGRPAVAATETGNPDMGTTAIDIPAREERSPATDNATV
jgi:hypothetical protein